MRKNLSTIILILIFLVGLSVMLYPSVSDAVNRKHQSRAVAGYAEEVEQLSDADYQTYFDAADAYNRQLNTTPNAFYKPELVSGYINRPASLCSLAGRFSVRSAYSPPIPHTGNKQQPFCSWLYVKQQEGFGFSISAAMPFHNLFPRRLHLSRYAEAQILLFDKRRLPVCSFGTPSGAACFFCPLHNSAAFFLFPAIALHQKQKCPLYIPRSAL